MYYNNRNKNKTGVIQMKTATVQYLNQHYTGVFRELTPHEYSYLVNKLNPLEQQNNEWYEPYAIRESTMDVVSRYDGYFKTSDALFTHVSHFE